MVRRSSVVGRASGALLVVFAVGVATGTPSGNAGALAHAHAGGPALVQASTESPALLDYFTFIPQAILLLVAVGLRRYALDDEDIPWWLDRDALRARTAGLVPNFRRPGSSSDPSNSEGTDDADAVAPSTGTASSQSGATTSSSSATQSTAPIRDETATSGATATATSGGQSRSPNTSTSSAGSAGQRGRASGPVPDRLSLAYSEQRITVRDGETVDEEIRGMLRAAGEAEHTKWIDDRHLHFIRDEHGFTMVVYGENLTRLNGDRLQAGDRARVYPGDEIELSGIVTLVVEGA